MAVLSVCFLVSIDVNAAPVSFMPSQLSATIQVDDEAFSLPLNLDEDGTGFTHEAADPSEPLNFTGGSVRVGSLFGEFDPVLNLGFAAQDFGDPSTFQVTLKAPLTPNLFGTCQYHISMGGVFSDGGSDGGSISQVGTTTYGVMDVGLDASAVDGLGGSAVFSAQLEIYGPYAKSGIFDCGGGGCEDFYISLAFLGSGDNDSYTLNGRFEIDVVPIPATLFLFGSGIFSLLGLRRRLLMR
jgi:hypothetical protein